ncbi:unnamed protein product [Spirodela intermedia]|uniref:Uncharacterized protein n=1 Tax=Spirodela intermedia TaxID=51605 RepID=A0A7I8L0R9_SPIIN|nr:unnamed protein product [Spirodela intermedia]
MSNFPLPSPFVPLPSSAFPHRLSPLP